MAEKKLLTFDENTLKQNRIKPSYMQQKAASTTEVVTTSQTNSRKAVQTPELDKAVGNNTPWHERVRNTLETGTAKAADALQLGMLNAEAGLFEAGGKVAEFVGAAGGRDAVNKSPFDWLYTKADEARKEADAVRQRAYDGTGKAGQFALQAIEGGSKLASDVAVSSITGFPAMSVTAAGAFGSGAYEAEQEGATLGQSIAYGAGTAGLEAAIEKLTGGLGKIYGKGATDDFVKNLVQRTTGNEAAQRALSVFINAVGEGGEEALTTVLDPFVKAIYDKGETARNVYGRDLETYKELGKEALYSAAVGAVIGAAGDIATGGLKRPTQSNPLADTILSMEAERAQQANPHADTLMGEDSTSVNTDPTQAPQGEQMQADGTSSERIREYVEHAIAKSRYAPNPLIVEEKVDDLPIGKVSPELAGKIKNEYGIDISDRKHVLRDNDIRHMYNSHGPHTNEAEPLWAADIRMIPTIIAEANEVYYVPRDDGRAGLVYQYQYNGTTFYLEQIVDGEDILLNKQMIKVPTGTIPNLPGLQEAIDAKKEVPTPAPGAADATQLRSAAGPQMYVQDVRGGTSDGTIPQNGPVVNEQGPDMPGWAQEEPPPVNSNFDRSTEGQPGGTERTSHTPYTVRNARVTPEEMRGIIDRKGAEGEYNYWAITNDETVQRASEAIAREGWDSAYAAWVNDVKNGKAGDQVTATGAILYNHALSAGNKALAADILLTYQDALRNTARGLQAGKIIQQLSPDSRLYMIQRSIDRYAADMGLQDDIVLSDELKQAYRDAKTEADRNAVIEQMQKEVAAQLPASPMEKWVALRYVNMLGNFKTQIRNVGGNVTSRGLSGIKNAVRTSIESLVYSKESGKRTSSYFVGKEYMDAGRSDFRDTMKDAVLGGGKYSDTSPQGFMRGVQEQKRIFANPLLEGYRKATNWAMETGDQIFSEEAYARAIAGWMKAKGISADQFRAMLEAEKAGDISAQDSKRLSDARMFAKQEAQEITFRDDNAFSNWISKIGRRKDTPKAARILAEGALPFRKTPANVLVRAVEYSPIGTVEAAYKLVQSRKPGSDITGADVINSLSKSLTGTGLFLLGAALKNAGWLTGGEDDRKQDAFNDLRGKQAWALFLPDGTNFTLDWASSIAFPLFMGAEFAAAVGDDGVQWADLDDAMLSIVDPLLEFSMMQGISDTLDSVKYSENNLIQLAAQTAVGYLSQGLTNSLFGQAERSTESGRKETYIDRDSGVPVWVQQSIGKTSAKTPGWDHNQVDYVDAWGRTQDYGKGNLFNQFLNPSYVSTDRSTAVDDELQRLYDAGQTAVFPQRFAQSDQVTTYDADGESTGKRYLTAEEYEQFNRTMGETRLELAEKLIQSSAYKAMGNEAKAKAISLVYEYGKAVATKEVEASYKLDGWMQKAMDSDDPARYIQMYAATKALTPPEGSDSVKKYQELGVMAKQSRDDAEADGWIKGQFTELQGKKYDLAREYGFSPERFVEFYEAQSVCDNNKQKVIDYLTNKKGWPADQANNIAKLCSLWGSKEETVNNWRW